LRLVHGLQEQAYTEDTRSRLRSDDPGNPEEVPEFFQFLTGDLRPELLDVFSTEDRENIIPSDLCPQLSVIDVREDEKCLLLNLDRLARWDGDGFAIGPRDRDRLIAGVGGRGSAGRVIDGQRPEARWIGTAAPVKLEGAAREVNRAPAARLATGEDRGGGERERGCGRRIGASLQEEPAR
jgi:hypothetical protein